MALKFLFSIGTAKNEGAKIAIFQKKVHLAGLFIKKSTVC